LLKEYDIDPMPAIDGSGSSEGYIPIVRATRTEEAAPIA
jgi:hypothetical protein